MTGYRITAGAPLPVITRELAQAGWGPLTGREWQGVRSVLRALGDVLHPRYGQGDTTAWQISRATGLSERWTRACLGWLEDAGLIEWKRGGVYEGRPQPGWVRVIKTALVDLVRAARPASDQASRDRSARTRLRLARAGIVTIRRQHRRRSDHAEPDAYLTPLRRGREGTKPIPSAPTDTQEGIDMRRTGPDPRYMPVNCTHGLTPERCNRCKYDALMAEQDARHAQGARPATPAPVAGDNINEEWDRYMRATYPGLTGAALAKAAMHDPKARELARA